MAYRRWQDEFLRKLIRENGGAATTSEDPPQVPPAQRIFFLESLPLLGRAGPGSRLSAKDTKEEQPARSDERSPTLFSDPYSSFDLRSRGRL